MTCVRASMVSAPKSRTLEPRGVWSLVVGVLVQYQDEHPIAIDTQPYMSSVLAMTLHRHVLLLRRSVLKCVV
eukprot:6485644-Amphidinium_carterae.1